MNRSYIYIAIDPSIMGENVVVHAGTNKRLFYQWFKNNLSPNKGSWQVLQIAPFKEKKRRLDIEREFRVMAGVDE